MPSSDLAACVDAFAAEVDFVYEVLLGYGVVDADADDLVQEVFLVLWRRWEAYDRSRPLRAWLRGIAARVALKHRARQRSRREVPGGLVDRPDDTPTAEERIDAATRRSLLLDLLASLPEKQREVVLLHDVEEISMREVAAVLDVPLKTAHTRLRTARLELERRLRQLRAIGGARADTARDLSMLGPGLFAPSRRPGVAVSPERRRRALRRARALAPLPALRRGEGDGAGWTLRPLARAVCTGAVAAAVAIVVHQGRDQGGLPTAMAPDQAARSGATGAEPPRWTREAAAPALPLGAEATDEDHRPSPAGDPGRLPGLAAHFTFDESAGSRTARDRSGRGNDCAIKGRTPAGVDWAPGLRGQALDLNGYGWLECQSREALGRLRGELTIAAWVKRTGEREHIRSLVTWHYRPESLDYFQFGFRHERLFLRTGVDDRPVTAPSAPPRGRWAHVALTVAADGTARFFVDGLPIHQATVAARAHLGSTTHPMLIGALGNRLNSARAHEVVQALVDDVALYDRALTDPEIAALAAVAPLGMASAQPAALGHHRSMPR